RSAFGLCKVARHARHRAQQLFRPRSTSRGHHFTSCAPFERDFDWNAQCGASRGILHWCTAICAAHQCASRRGTARTERSGRQSSFGWVLGCKCPSDRPTRRTPGPIIGWQGTSCRRGFFDGCATRIYSLRNGVWICPAAAEGHCQDWRGVLSGRDASCWQKFFRRQRKGTKNQPSMATTGASAAGTCRRRCHHHSRGRARAAVPRPCLASPSPAAVPAAAAAAAAGPGRHSSRSSW
ncbi:unnamed protein product, partial [Phaeothamnion confervicola]